MAVIRKSWTKYIPYLEFHIRLPYLIFGTRLLTESYERMSYDIIRIYLKIWKWEVFEFQLYKKDRTR